MKYTFKISGYNKETQVRYIDTFLSYSGSKVGYNDYIKKRKSVGLSVRRLKEIDDKLF